MQERIKGVKGIEESGEEEADEMPEMPSTIPFLPHLVSFEMILLGRRFGYSPKKACL